MARASQSLKGLDWFEVTEVRGLVHEGKVSQFQVKLKVGFRIMSEDEMKGAQRPYLSEVIAADLPSFDALGVCTR